MPSRLTYDEILTIATRAAGGDNAALRELGKINAKYSRAANQRLRALEKAGFTGTAAYKYSGYDTGRPDKPRYYQGKTGSAEQLLRNLENVTRFLNYQSSTVIGEKKRREKVLKGLEKAGYNVGEDRQAFQRFLESDAWTEFKAMFGSKDAMQKVSDQMEQGASIDDLIKSYDDFVKGESESEDILQVWDGWVSEKD